MINCLLDKFDANDLDEPEANLHLRTRIYILLKLNEGSIEHGNKLLGDHHVYLNDEIYYYVKLRKEEVSPDFLINLG